MANIWDSPPVSITPHTRHSTEGYPVFGNSTPVAVYDDSGFSTQREGKLLEKIQYYNAAGDTALEPTLANAQLLEAGVYNECRILFYHQMNRLRRLIWLACGANLTNLQADDDIISPNFYETVFFTATGSGTSISISWTSGFGPARIHGHRDFPYSAAPGTTFIGDGRVWSDLVDIEYTSKTTATLTVDRPLNPDAGSVQVYAANKPWNFPVLHLADDAADVTDPPRCRYDVEVDHSAFSSFASAWPNEPVSAGIEGNRYCVQMAHGDVDLSEFKTGDRCNNTDCPLYQAHTQGYETPNDLSLFWLGRGDYERQLNISISNIGNFRSGRDDFPGLLTLIGMRTVCFSPQLGLNIAAKDYDLQWSWSNWGVVYYDTGLIENGFKVFRNFTQEQAARINDGGVESDDVGLIAELKADQDKDDYAQSGAIQDRSGGTPAYAFEKAIGVRRLQYIGFTSNPGTPTGSGDNRIQRTSPIRYTSPTFTTASSADDKVYTNDLTEVKRLADPITSSLYTGGSITYDTIFRVPQFQRSTNRDNPSPETKTSASIASVIVDVDEVELQFTLGTMTLQYNNPAYPGDPFAPPTLDSTFDIGGNVVSPEQSQLCYHEDSTDRIGDPQRRLTPGDVLVFESGIYIKGISLICIRAYAMDGEEVEGQRDPNVSVAGLSQFQLENMHKRDRAVFALEGISGKTVADRIESEGFPIACSIYRSAVCPLNVTPALKLVQGETVTTVSSSLWDFDRATGAFHIDGRGWPVAPYRLHAQFSSVFDCQGGSAVENFLAMKQALDTVREHGWIRASWSGGSADGRGVIVNMSGEQFSPLNLSLQIGEGTDLNSQGVYTDSYFVVDNFGENIAGGRMGCEISNSDDPEERVVFAWAESGFQELGPGNILNRLKSSDVSAAYADLRIAGAIYKQTYYFDEATPGSLINTTELLGEADITIQIYKATLVDGRYQVHPLTTTSPASGERIFDEDEERWEYRATVNVTEIVKYVLDNPWDTIFASPRVLNPDAGSDVFDVLEAFITGSSTDSGGFYEWDFEAYLMDFSSFGIGGPKIKLTPEALTSGAKFHYDADQAALGPNMGG